MRVVIMDSPTTNNRQEIREATEVYDGMEVRALESSHKGAARMSSRPIPHNAWHLGKRRMYFCRERRAGDFTNSIGGGVQDQNVLHERNCCSVVEQSII